MIVYPLEPPPHAPPIDTTSEATVRTGATGAANRKETTESTITEAAIRRPAASGLDQCADDLVDPGHDSARAAIGEPRAPSRR